MARPRRTTEEEFYDVFSGWDVGDQGIALRVLEQIYWIAKRSKPENARDDSARTAEPDRPARRGSEMSLELSLFQIEDGLRDLYSMREEAREALHGAQTQTLGREEDAARAELLVIDNAIREYLHSEVKKTDGVADFILMLDRLCHEQRERKGGVERCDIDREIDRLKARRDSLREVLANVKDNVKFVMEGMLWREGKPKKLEGIRHTLTLRGNGGKQPVVVTDESLIPDELCRVMVDVNAAVWCDFLTALSKAPGVDPSAIECLRTDPVRVPSLSRIGEALAKPCERCFGQGRVCSECNETVNCGRKLEDAITTECPDCSGAGKQSVPGARLGERGESVVVK